MEETMIHSGRQQGLRVAVLMRRTVCPLLYPQCSTDEYKRKAATGEHETAATQRITT